MKILYCHMIFLTTIVIIYSDSKDNSSIISHVPERSDKKIGTF